MVGYVTWQQQAEKHLPAMLQVERVRVRAKDAGVMRVVLSNIQKHWLSHVQLFTVKHSENGHKITKTLKTEQSSARYNTVRAEH